MRFQKRKSVLWRRRRRERKGKTFPQNPQWELRKLRQACEQQILQCYYTMLFVTQCFFGSFPSWRANCESVGFPIGCGFSCLVPAPRARRPRASLARAPGPGPARALLLPGPWAPGPPAHFSSPGPGPGPRVRSRACPPPRLFQLACVHASPAPTPWTPASPPEKPFEHFHNFSAIT